MLVNLNQQRICRKSPDTNYKVVSDSIYDVHGSVLGKAVCLPNNRVFLIGGSQDLHCNRPLKETFEIVNG